MSQFAEATTAGQADPATDAASILLDAADTLTDRARQRDRPIGERSMARAVKAFNALYGLQLTELQGWQFMVLLKMSRSSASHVLRVDDYIDQAGYAALAGECAAHTAQGTRGSASPATTHTKPHFPT